MSSQPSCGLLMNFSPKHSRKTLHSPTHLLWLFIRKPFRHEHLNEPSELRHFPLPPHTSASSSHSLISAAGNETGTNIFMISPFDTKSGAEGLLIYRSTECQSNGILSGIHTSLPSSSPVSRRAARICGPRAYHIVAGPAIVSVSGRQPCTPPAGRSTDAFCTPCFCFS